MTLRRIADGYSDIAAAPQGDNAQQRQGHRGGLTSSMSC
jgi:hypothetical protein